jgi:DNA replication and repair protein RecF
MALQRLTIEDVRCIRSADLQLEPSRNLFSGANGSGKTSLLEAVYFLGRARSFRTPRSEVLIRSGSERFRTVGHLSRGPGPSVLGLEYSRAGLQARYDGRSVSGTAELATIFPVQAIDPELHQLIEEGPRERRRYLDWGVFHVEPRFVDAWQRFQRALRQRNASLRSRAASPLVRAWDAELIESGARIAEARGRYLETLRPQVRLMGERLLSQVIELELAHGWAADRSLEDALDRSWARDSEQGVTHVGPHRADLRIQLDDAPARERVSRGQQKLLAAAMLLGQLRCDAEQGSATAALLVDDPAAELDRDGLRRLLGEILELPVQLFVTALDHADRALSPLGPVATFHVERGEVTRLV